MRLCVCCLKLKPIEVCIKKIKRINLPPAKWLRKPWFTRRAPCQVPRNRRLHENNNVAPNFIPTSKSPLWPLCSVCAGCAVSGWLIDLRFSMHWQIYQANVHLWWGCFYIWDWGGEGSLQPKQRRRKRGHADRLRIYDIHYVFTPTQRYCMSTRCHWCWRSRPLGVKCLQGPSKSFNGQLVAVP